MRQVISHVFCRSGKAVVKTVEKVKMWEREKLCLIMMVSRRYPQ